MSINKIKILFLVISMSSLILTGSVLAQQNDDVDDPAANPAATEALKDRVDKVVQEKKSPDNNNQTQRGFVGKVERVSAETITIRNPKGAQVIPLSEKIRLTKNDEAVEVTDIEIDDSAIVLGIQEKDSFTPVKIIFSSEDLRPKPQLVLIGTLNEIANTQLTLECRKEGREHKIVINNQTKFEDLAEDEIARVDLFENMQVIVAGEIDIDEEKETETKTARIVRALVAVE